MYQALYRKWRPRTFDDGKDHLRQDTGTGGELRASGERQSLQ